MDVGVHSSASCATKADAVPAFARAVELRNRLASASGGRQDLKLVGQGHLIAGPRHGPVQVRGRVSQAEPLAGVPQADPSRHDRKRASVGRQAILASMG